VTGVGEHCKTTYGRQQRDYRLHTIRESASIAGHTEDAHTKAVWGKCINWARATCNEILLQSLMYLIAENIFRILLKASFHISLLFEVMLCYFMSHTYYWHFISPRGQTGTVAVEVRCTRCIVDDMAFKNIWNKTTTPLCTAPVEGGALVVLYLRNSRHLCAATTTTLIHF